ncbi:unnamed protein product, partial [Scytosiphon promiscuus]
MCRTAGGRRKVASTRGTDWLHPSPTLHTPGSKTSLPGGLELSNDPHSAVPCLLCISTWLEKRARPASYKCQRATRVPPHLRTRKRELEAIGVTGRRDLLAEKYELQVFTNAELVPRKSAHPARKT